MLAILTSHPIQYQAPLWRALAEDGSFSFEVWFLTDHAVRPTNDREFGKTFAWDIDLLEGYPHIFLPIRQGWRMDKFTGIKLSKPWARLFKERGITRLWVEGWRFLENWAAIHAAHTAGIEIWMRAETNDLRSRSCGLRDGVRRFVLTELFRRIQFFLCIGTANRRFYQSFGVEDSRFLDAPYSVDNRRFSQQTTELKKNRLNLRREWKIPEDSFCVLFCGKFIPKKRPMDLVNAAQIVLKGALGPKLHLLFIGSGELGCVLRAACSIEYDADNPAGLPSAMKPDLPSATFAGFLNQGEINRAYVAADCLVLPSDTGETWGLVVNEAMASGLPCIISDACGCAEDLGRLASGFIFQMGDVQALAASLVDAATCVPFDETKFEDFNKKFTLTETVKSVAGALR